MSFRFMLKMLLVVSLCRSDRLPWCLHRVRNIGVEAAFEVPVTFSTEAAFEVPVSFFAEAAFEVPGTCFAESVDFA